MAGALQKGIITSIPDMDCLLEVANILPADAEMIKPIITCSSTTAALGQSA
jgi:hypothetical protein